MDFLDNELLSAHLKLIALQTESDQPDSPVIIRVEDEGFDPKSYLRYQIATDPHKKAAAERKILSIIRTYLNQGKDAFDIELDYQDDPGFNAVFGKHFRKNLERYIEKSRVWDEHKNMVLVWDCVIKHTVDINNSKIRKDARALFPLLLTITALFITKDCNRKAILATRILRNVGASLTLNEVDLDPKNQKRRWLALEKQGSIKFYLGKQGGDSNRVEILSNENVYLVEDKQKAVEQILTHVRHEEMREALSAVLVAIASMSDAPRYNDCDLQNKVEDLIRVFKPIAEGVVETRKAERLVESVEFEAAVQAEAQELTEKITAHLASGKGLQPCFVRAAVEAPESHVEAATIKTRKSLRAESKIAAEKLSRLHGEVVPTQRKSITAGIVF